MPVKHKFFTNQPQSLDSTKVSRNQWNDVHSITTAIITTTTDLSLDASHELVKVNGGSGAGVVIWLPDLNLMEGVSFTIKRMDSGTAPVTIMPRNGQAIDDDPAYVLTNKNQFLKIVGDASNGTWTIHGSN